MTTTATKPRTRKRPFPEKFDLTYLRTKGRRTAPNIDHVGQADSLIDRDLLADFEATLGAFAEPIETHDTFKEKVDVFLIRCSHMSQHVFSRLRALAAKTFDTLDPNRR